VNQAIVSVFNYVANGVLSSVVTEVASDGVWYVGKSLILNSFYLLEGGGNRTGVRRDPRWYLQ
jgi:hypothetical protein